MLRVSIHTIGLLAAFWFASFQQAFAECGKAYSYTQGSRSYTQEGRAHPTRNRVDISAAHLSLPAGTRVVVRNQRKGRSIIVTIASRSSISAGGIIELSPGAMNALGMDDFGPVCLEVVSYGSKKRGYEKPLLVDRLLEAVNPKARHFAKANSQTHYAHARSGTRSAKAHRGRRHYARARHGSGRRYAQLHRRNHTVKRSRHRRQLASRS